MIVKKCDRCKKEFDLGYKIEVNASAPNPCANACPFILYEHEYDICFDCISEVAKFLHPEEVSDE